MGKSLFTNVSMEDFGLGNSRATLSDGFSMEAYEMAEQTAMLFTEVSDLNKKIARADFLRAAMESFDGEIDETTQSVIDFAMEADEEDKKDSDSNGDNKRGAIMTAVIKAWRWIKSIVQKMVAWFSKYYHKFVDFMRAQVRKAKAYFSKVAKLSDSDKIEFKSYFDSWDDLMGQWHKFSNTPNELAARGEYLTDGKELNRTLGGQDITVKNVNDNFSLIVSNNSREKRKTVTMTGKEAKAAEKDIEKEIDTAFKDIAVVRDYFNKLDKSPVWDPSYVPTADEVKEHKEEVQRQSISVNFMRKLVNVLFKEINTFASAMNDAAKDPKKEESKDTSK